LRYVFSLDAYTLLGPQLVKMNAADSAATVDKRRILFMCLDFKI
jgi:hypothetical protein